MQLKIIDDKLKVDFSTYKVGDYVFIDVNKDVESLSDNYVWIEFICNMYIEVKGNYFRRKIFYKDLQYIGKVTRYC